LLESIGKQHILERQFLKVAYLQLAHGQCHGTTFTTIADEGN